MMYMNGRGVIARTQELNDELFAKIPHAVGGWSLILGGPILCWSFIVHRFPWQEPASSGAWLAAIILSVVSMLAGVWLYLFWHRALGAVTRHRKAMEEETEQRGKGWAKS